MDAPPLNDGSRAATHTAPRCPVAPAPSTEQQLVAEIVHRYVCEGRSTYAIAALAGLDRQRVGRLLAEAGITLRPRGAGGRRPGRRGQEPPDLPGLLRDLYVERGLSSTAIARLLGMGDRVVRARLAEAGIERRHRGFRPRQDRHTLPVTDLQSLYVHAELPADEVGRLLRASRGTVLRNAHESGLPVRLGGPPARRGPREIELIDALYADQQVAAALARHGVSARPPGGRLWERFPQPVPLSAALLCDLYQECGVSIAHIELLTGRPVPTIRRALLAAAVPLRPPGGRCPFLRRWRISGRVGGFVPRPEGETADAAPVESGP